MPWQNLTLKGALAFFLVCVAAFMVLLWMIRPPAGDSAQIGLLAGFVTLFIKMAADAIGYQYNSSSGSDKKDETQAVVAGKLADKVITTTSPAPTPTVVIAWWSVLTDAERATISASTDARVQAFVAAAQVGKATVDDLTYLVGAGLLTQERATAIQST